MNGRVTKLCNVDSIAIPQEMLELRVEESSLDAEIQKLSLRCARKHWVQTAAAGDIVYCRGDREAYPDDREILLYTATALPGAEAAAAAVLGKKPGDSFRTNLLDRPVRLTVEKILRREPVEINDALVETLGIDGVKNLAEYREHLRSKALADEKMTREKSVMQYLMERMEADSEFSYDEAEMEDHIREAARDYAQQMAAEEESGEEEMDPREFREAVRSQVKQGWLVEAFCRERGIALDEAEAQAEADQMAELSSLMGEAPQDREELLDMARQNQYYTAFFAHLEELVNEKMGGSYGDR